ncbi:MAG TPA: CPBP family intramembrane glutamic endopeptidase [Terracidiphilus sp.]|nr:CPBP family intramembrane glutamic endopeptidase [Terracidiphilus sp.]
MEPENYPNAPDAVVPQPEEPIALPPEPVPPPEKSPFAKALRWTFLGPQGLRAGWSVALFIGLLVLFTIPLGMLMSKLHLVGKRGEFTPSSAFFGELTAVIGMIAAGAIVALIERRRILDYNLTGPRRTVHFFSGLGFGFLALSALVGSMYLGGWLHFGQIALSGTAIFKYAAIWGCAFLLVGCFEEGTMRCFLLYTFTRGLNFWWALGIVGAICLDLVLRAKGNGPWGVYVIALLGLIPCLLLDLKKAPSAGFWQAAWVTSALFGFGHTGNNGENWIGIFAAAFIGFVFCVSVKVTGSAWWAIGCHMGWDWAETYFYGTADSGLVARGHYLTTITSGNPLWSGGSDGPEGSLLVIGICLLLLAALLVIYGRRGAVQPPMPAAEHFAG